MNFRNALIMSLMLVLGGLYLLKFDSLRENEGPGSGENHPFSGLKIEDFRSLSVTIPNGPKAGSFTAAAASGTATGEFFLTDPQGVPVEKPVLESMLKALVDLHIKNRVEASDIEGDMAVYGLKNPLLKVSFSANDLTHNLEFGGKHAISGRRYVRIDTKPDIYLVDDLTFAALTKTKLDVRDHRPLKFNTAKVSQLIVRRADGELRFVGGLEQEGWKLQYSPPANTQIASKQEFTADQKLVREIISKLTRIKAKDFPAAGIEAAKDFGLDSPKLRIEIVGPEPLIVSIGEVENKNTESINANDNEEELVRERFNYYLNVTGEKWVYQVSQSIVAVLNQPVETFRDKAPFSSLVRDKISRVLISKNSGNVEFFTLARGADLKSSKWKVEDSLSVVSSTGANSAEGSPTQISNWLEKIVNFRVLSYPGVGQKNWAKIQIDRPEYEIEIITAGMDKGVKLILANEVESSTDEQSGGEDAPRYGAVKFSDDSLIPIVLSALDFRELVKEKSYFLATKPNPGS